MSSPDRIPDLIAHLQERFPEAVLGHHRQHGDDALVVDPAYLLEVLRHLRDEPGAAMNFLMDLTVVDFLTHPKAPTHRFEGVYHLFSLRHGHRLRIKSPVAPGGTLPSATPLWASADWMEREAWEMYGVPFVGHPNLKRLLTHVEFVGHPLRKDYATKKRQVLRETDSLMDEMDARLRLKGLK